MPTARALDVDELRLLWAIQDGDALEGWIEDAAQERLEELPEDAGPFDVERAWADAEVEVETKAQIVEDLRTFTSELRALMRPLLNWLLNRPLPRPRSHGARPRPRAARRARRTARSPGRESDPELAAAWRRGTRLRPSEAWRWSTRRGHLRSPAPIGEGMAEQPLLYPRPEAARLLGVSVDTIARMVAAGTLKPVYLRPNAHPRFRRVDLERIGAEEAAAP